MNKIAITLLHGNHCVDLGFYSTNVKHIFNKRWNLINFLIQLRHYQSYLEIGMAEGACFQHVNASRKVGVDHAKHKVTQYQTQLQKTTEQTYILNSDDYFAQHQEQFDIIFIDGNHSYQCALQDIRNALSVLNQNGVVVVHDCRCNSPCDVWKAVLHCRIENQVKLQTVEIDCGCCLVVPDKNQPLLTNIDIETIATLPTDAGVFPTTSEKEHPLLTRKALDEMLNLITLEQFIQQELQ